MNPELRIQIIQRSLRCRRLGLWGLIPGLGILFAVPCIFLFFSTRRLAGGDWNPARRYLDMGMTCGCLGILLTLALTLMVVTGLLS